MEAKRRRQKPAVADVNMDAAVQNIGRKISCLQEWIRNGVPYVCDEFGTPNLADGGRQVLDYFPKTIRQFNFWDGSQNCPETRKKIGTLRRNANDTLRRHEALRRSVEMLLTQIVRVANDQRLRDRPETVARIKRQWNVERSRNILLEAELIAGRKNFKALEEENRRLRQLNDDISRKSHEAISSLEDEVIRLSSEVASLNKKLLKLIPLKKVR